MAPQTTDPLRSCLLPPRRDSLVRAGRRDLRRNWPSDCLDSHHLQRPRIAPLFDFVLAHLGVSDQVRAIYQLKPDILSCFSVRELILQFRPFLCEFETL